MNQLLVFAFSEIRTHDLDNTRYRWPTSSVVEVVGSKLARGKIFTIFIGSIGCLFNPEL